MEFELFKWSGLENFRSPAEVPDPDRVLIVILINENDQMIVTSLTTTKYMNIKNASNHFGYKLVAWTYKMWGKKRRRAKK